jgi:hypothetical protein
MPTPATNSQLRNAELGFRASSGTPKTMPLNATTTIFTVSGGRIMIGLLYGVVTTIIGGTTPAIKLVATPTVGTANDMCTALTITADEVGMMFVCPIAVGSALIGAAAAGKSGSASGPGLGGQVVAPGTIGINNSAADATGAAQWTLFYIPLDPASNVVAS